MHIYLCLHKSVRVCVDRYTNTVFAKLHQQFSLAFVPYDIVCLATARIPKHFSGTATYATKDI